MLLLSPLLRSVINETQKPVVVLAQDESESVLAEMRDTSIYRQRFERLKQTLKDNYDLKTYSFGEDVREGIDFKYKDKVSNISEFFTEVYDLYSNQNLGAIVLATDGIYNEGSNPIYSGTKLSAPIFTIALGDTTPNKDLIVKRVFHNKITYLGDKFSIQVDISALNCAGNSTILQIAQVNGDGSLTRLSQQAISINKNDFFTTKEIIINADRAGVQRYMISVNKVNGEVTTRNNSQEIFVDILDARQKILILAAAPHPDISAIKTSLSKNKNYQLTVAYANQPSVNVAGFDFVVLHQLPSKKNNISGILQTLQTRKIPRLFIVGTQSDLNAVSQAQNLVKITGRGNNHNDIQAVVKNNFNLFTIDERLLTELPKFAPLLSPFGEFTPMPEANILLNQRIGKVETKYPLLAIGQKEATKLGVLCGEGIWKWRVFDYMQHQNHQLFDELLGKTVQYLTLKEDKRKFRVSVNKNIFKENESIYFDAELYNESYELINEPDASLTIKDSQGKDFPFTFNKVNKSYTLNAGFFPVGNYTFKGVVNSNGEQLTYDGKFSVKPIQLEIFETTANHSILKILSDKYGGNLVYPSEIDSLPKIIAQKDTVKPILYSTLKTRSIINLKWIFFLLLGLLSLEWFGRKYYGGY